jgi:hypothetical protein
VYGFQFDGVQAKSFHLMTEDFLEKVQEQLQSKESSSNDHHVDLNSAEAFPGLPTTAIPKPNASWRPVSKILTNAVTERFEIPAKMLVKVSNAG